MDVKIVFYIIIGILLLIIGVIFLGMWLKRHWTWIKFSRELRQQRKKLKHNLGLLFVMNKADSIGIPRFINLEDYSKEIGKKRFLQMKEQMQGLKYLGMPMIILPSEDTNVQ